MMKTKGAALKRIKRCTRFKGAKAAFFNLSFLATSVFTYLLIFNQTQFPIFVTIFFFLISIYLFLFVLHLNRINYNTAVLTIYENGIESSFFKYSGDTYIPWSNVKSCDLETKKTHLVDFKTLVVQLKDVSQTNEKPFWLPHCSFDGQVDASSISITVSPMLDCDVEELEGVCNHALESYNEKHGIKD